MEKGKGYKLIRTVGTYMLYGVTAASVFLFPRIAESAAAPKEPTTMNSKENLAEGEFVVYSINKNGVTRVSPVLSEETKVEENGDGVYQVPSDATVIVKHADGDAAVWSATPIENPDQFKADYLATGTDPSIKDDTNFHYYSGDGTFNWKADIGNQWTEASTFTTTGNITTIYIPVGKLSHLNYLTSSTPTIPVSTPTPSDPGTTPTPSDPGTTPTPSDPGQTPTPTVPGTTPTPNTTSYPKTGYNDKNMPIRERFNVMASTMTKEEKIATIAGLGIIGAASVGVATYEVVKHVKAKRRNYNHR